jgi:hypothetical protein
MFTREPVDIFYNIMMDEGTKNGLGTAPFFGIALVIATTWVFLDAAFQLSRISFFSRLGAFEVARSLINSLAVILLCATAAIAIAKLLLMAARPLKRAHRWIRSLLLFILWLVLISIVFVHMDVWMYTTFPNIHVRTLPRLLNWALLLAIITSSVLLAKRGGEEVCRFFSGRTGLVAGAYFLVFLFFGISTLQLAVKEHLRLKGSHASAKGAAGLPNIVLLSADGLEASHMSAYGYGRETTPNINKLAEQSIVYQKAFTNSANSRGSVVSILTGKSPLMTKVISFPDVLNGTDSLEHLPGILAGAGYYNIDAGDHMHTVPRRYNMRSAFHSENGKDSFLGIDNAHVFAFKGFFNMEMHFLAEMWERVRSRIEFVTGIPMTPEFYWGQDDEKRLSEILRKIREVDSPLFIRVQLMKTHGPEYKGIIRRFSAGKTRTVDADPDSYDDAIHAFDRDAGRLISALEEAGKFDNTVLILHTDHGQYPEYAEMPLPLIVHLPGQQERRTVDIPVQYIDIAPSVLNCLGLEVPGWMEGIPIFPDIRMDGEMKMRPIYSTTKDTFFDKEKRKWLKKSTGPPFFGLGIAAVLMDGIMYRVNLPSGEEEFFNIYNSGFSTGGVDHEGLKEDYRQLLFSYMGSRDIDVSAIIPKDQAESGPGGT